MSDLPLWGSIAFAILVIGGATLTLLGCIGMLRFPSFYARIHAPTLGTSFGMVGIVLASALYFTLIQGRPVLHEILLVVFIIVTTPVTLMLLSRAALHRDRSEGDETVPLPNLHPKDPPPTPGE
ncbi:monovalent cation/H(+) antiporter subunit G [Pelagibacterium lacus]|uniref:Cation:proton antiporter n=1 Tax=Pelagibacterium lacus TaxID=2282655 RepID=A0A369W741_9HYPH|nr:monovalent cation/H(+) antiporter subunit G [Pelagibacterium lacus]RDE09160.1 cation:proton antiporter [Pelagibacterium lacus]